MVDAPPAADLRPSIELFFFAYRSFTSRPDHILERLGLGRVHHRILYFVGRNPGLTVNDLLKTLAVSKQALHGPLRKLIQAKLIAAATAAHDRRVKELSLTAEGRRLEQRLTATQTRHLEAAFAAAGPKAVDGWHAVMREMQSGQSSEQPYRSFSRVQP